MKYPKAHDSRVMNRNSIVEDRKMGWYKIQKP